MMPTMSIGGYFVSEEQEKAKRYDIRQKGLELKKHLATLKSALKDHAAAWKTLSDTLSGSDSYTFESKDYRIEVTSSDPKERTLPGHAKTIKRVASVSLTYFDGESLSKLFLDLEETKKALNEVKAQCIEMGDPLGDY